MGYERFLSPNSDYSDFEIHRAQMRHYDDYMARVEDAGISGSFSTGFSYTGDSTGGGGGHLSVAGPDVVRKVAAGGALSPDGVNLEPVLEPENTVIGMGFRWNPHPGWSDIETGAEQRYGDIVAIPFGVANVLADTSWNAGMRVDGARVYRDFVEPLEPMLDDDVYRETKSSFFDGVVDFARHLDQRKVELQYRDAAQQQIREDWFQHLSFPPSPSLGGW